MDLQISDFDLGSLVAVDESSRHPSPAHVSNIIRDIENTVFMPGEREAWEDLSPSERKRAGKYMQMGFLWERIVERAFAEAYGGRRSYRPGELCVDGIYGTPDGLGFQANPHPTPPQLEVEQFDEEFKATWKSSRRLTDGTFEKEFRSWLWQVKAYCWMMKVRVAYLRIFFLNGDYRESGPQVKTVRLEFTEGELEELWAMLKRHARLRGWI